MSGTLQFQLRPAWLPTLGSVLGGDSPLSLFPDGDGDEGAREALVREGLLAEEGQVAERYASVLQALASPHRVTRMRFRWTEESVEYRTHFSASGGPVAVVLSTDEVRIRAPAGTEVVRELLERHGHAPWTSGLDVGLTLPPREAGVAVALVDVHQERSGRGTAEEDSPGSVPAILRRVPGEGTADGGLPAAFAALGFEGSMARAEEVEGALRELERDGLAGRGDEDWCPAGDLLAVARATWPETASVTFEVLAVEAQGTKLVEAGAVVAGPGGIVGLRRTPSGSVRMEGMVEAGVIELLEELVHGEGPEPEEEAPVAPPPETKPEPPSAPEPWQDDGGPSTIPRINLAALRAMETGARTEVEEEPVTGLRPGPGSRGPLYFCGACGARVREGSRFCGKCGADAPQS